mgnify:CR=1 FL=1
MKPGILRAGLVILLALGALLYYRYRQPKFIAGEKAPDFSITLASGEEARLSGLLGKYVLLQFWGSWCGPCRAENPHLAGLYQKYHDSGLEIISIGIEQNPKAWQRAIATDGLVWKYHAIESSQFNGPLAKLFNIHSIPTTFLINPEGVIMGVNLDTEKMEKMLIASH